MILDIHAHVGRRNYAYRAEEFTNADLAARMKEASISKRCGSSFYDKQDNEYVEVPTRAREDLIPFAFLNPKCAESAAELEHLLTRQGFHQAPPVERMAKEPVRVRTLPQPIGPFSYAVKSRGMLYVSGALGVDDRLERGGGQQRGRSEPESIKAILDAARVPLANVGKLTAYLTHAGGYRALNECTAPVPLGAVPDKRRGQGAGSQGCHCRD